MGQCPLSSRGKPGSNAASHCFRTHMSIIFKFPNARELTAHIGQTVFVLDEERGWALVNTFYQKEGWSPLRNLAFHAETD